MKHYDGKLEALNRLNGEIKPKKLNARIYILNKLDLGFQFRKLTAYTGSASKRPTPTGKRVGRLNSRYVFFAAVDWIIHKFTARVDTAPTQDVGIDERMSVDNELSPTSHEAREIAYDRGIAMDIISDLISINLAEASYIRDIRMVDFADLIRADGAVAQVEEKVLRLARLSGAIEADASIVESRYNRFTAEHEADGGSARGQIVASETAFTSGRMASGASAGIVQASVDGEPQNNVSAGLLLGFFLEIEGNKMTLPQVFSGVQVGNILEIDLETVNTYWANAVVNNGVMSLVFAESVAPDGNILEVS